MKLNKSKYDDDKGILEAPIYLHLHAILDMENLTFKTSHAHTYNRSHFTS